MSSLELTTLAESGLDQEARETLASLLGAFATAFDPVLTALLEEFEHEIFTLADGARDPDRQKHYFEVVREVRRAREQLLPRVRQLLEHALARSAAPAPPPAYATTGTLAPAEAQLLTGIANDAAQKYERALGPLAQRYARLLGVPQVETEAFVLGPQQLLEVLRLAASEFTQPENRALFYRVLEHHWLNALRDGYEQASRTLPWSGATREASPATEAPAGATREAQAVTAPPLVPAAASETRAAVPAPAGATPPRKMPVRAESEVAAQTAIRVASPAPPQPNEPAPGDVTPLPSRFLRDGGADVSGFASPLTGWPLIGLTCFEHPAERESLEADLRDRYFRACDVLIARCQAERNAAPASDSAQSQGVAQSDDVHLVLSVMTCAESGAGTNPGALSKSLLTLKQDLITQLRQFAPEGKALRLNDDDNTTFELVGMLFDELAAAARPDANASALLRELRMPILRVALADKRFFTHGQHSARVLLAIVLEQALYWHESEQDAALVMVRLEDMVERMGGYKGSNALFDDVLNEYRAHQQIAARKAEVLERRQVESATGRERLQLARRDAESAVALNLASGNPPPLVRQLLEQDWVRLLALTNLGEGPGSLSYRNRLAVAARLIALFDQAQASPHVHRDEQEFLAREIESGLAKVGYAEDEAHRLTARLFGHDPVSADPRVLLHSLVKDGGAAPEAVVPIPQIGARDRQIQAQLGARARGAWLDFVVARDGSSARRKLAWIDSRGERCLLLNQRGMRVAEPALAWIALEIRAGRARVVPLDIETHVDRALDKAYRRVSIQPAATGAIKRA